MKKIDELKKYEPLYVIGHKSPDVDTIFSSYLLSNILNYLDIKAYPCILSEGYSQDKYNKNIIDDYLDFKPKVIDLKEVSKYKFVFVDHNDPVQSIGESSNCVFGLDHHKDSKKVKNMIFSDLCCNCLFIYEYFKDVYPFTEKEKQLITLATFTDTLFLKTDRYKERDRELVKELDIDFDSDELLEKYFIESDLSIGIDKYIEKSDRDFSYYMVNFSSSVIQILNSKDNIINEYKKAIKRKEDNHLGMIRIIKEKKTFSFFKINDNFIEFSYDFIASRASTVIPDILKYLENNINSCN